VYTYTQTHQCVYHEAFHLLYVTARPATTDKSWSQLTYVTNTSHSSGRGPRGQACSTWCCLCFMRVCLRCRKRVNNLPCIAADIHKTACETEACSGHHSQLRATYQSAYNSDGAVRDMWCRASETLNVRARAQEVSTCDENQQRLASL
jgi:hypothetical protein